MLALEHSAESDLLAPGEGVVRPLRPPCLWAWLF